MDVAGLAVVAASVLALFTLVPQIVRIHRTGHVAGLSLAWPLVAMATNAGWLWYLVDRDLLAAAWSTVAMLVVYAVLAGQLAARRVPWRRAAASAGAWAAVLAGLGAADAAAGTALLGLVLAVAVGVQLAPAVAAAWRDPTPAGLSPATWLLLLAETALWGVYGTANRDPAIMAFAALGVTGSALMLLRWWVTRHAVRAAIAGRTA